MVKLKAISPYFVPSRFWQELVRNLFNDTNYSFYLFSVGRIQSGPVKVPLFMVTYFNNINAKFNGF